MDLKTGLDALARASFCVTIRESRPISGNKPFYTDLLGFPGWRVHITPRLGLLYFRIVDQTLSDRTKAAHWDGFNLTSLITFLQTQQVRRVVARRSVD